eukprot:scaffold2421_cov390-Prasinococcus_capsulatus_cf.AAC.11
MSASSALATPATLPGMLPSVSRRAPIRCVHRAAQPCRQAPTRRELVHKCLFLSLVSGLAASGVRTVIADSAIHIAKVATVGSQPAARAEETDPEAQREAAESYEKSLGAKSERREATSVCLWTRRNNETSAGRARRVPKACKQGQAPRPKEPSKGKCLASLVRVEG